MAKMITTFPDQLGWQGRERGFKKLHEVYGRSDANYVLFVYKDTKKFEKEYSHLDTKEERVYVCEGSLEDLMNDLKIYNYSSNELVETASKNLRLKLTQKHFEKSFIRQPKSRVVEGEFYLVTQEEFGLIPFEQEPITSKREVFLSIKLNDSVPLNAQLKKYIKKHFIPVKTEQELNATMKYTPLINEDVKEYVPKTVNPKAFELAKKHDLTHLEFNFLNYFYETNKSLRNDVGQLYFDINSKGIGWGHSRGWVKEKMKNLIELGLVKFDSRHDCRDPKYTSWYFYDATKNIDRLKHDF